MSDHRRKKPVQPEPENQYISQPGIRVAMFLTALNLPAPRLCTAHQLSTVLGNNPWYTQLLEFARHEGHVRIAGGCRGLP